MVGTEDVELASAGDQGAMRRVLMSVIDAHNGLAQQVGYDPSASPSADASQNIDPPPQAQIALTAADGHFKVALTNPISGASNVAGTYRVEPSFGFAGVVFNGDPTIQVQDNLTLGVTTLDDSSFTRRIYHQVESSLTLNFDADGQVTIYGPSTSLNYDITDPGVTKYWRVKSRYENSDFNDYVYYVSPSVCGPVALYSGLLRNSSLVLNNAATTPTGANPLTQHGVTTEIDLAASVWKAGSDQILSYNPGQVDPGSFGHFFVYAKDAKRLGAAGPITVTPIATTNDADVTADDANIYFGDITTSGGGGGTGSGAGGGTCCRAGVPYRRFDGTNQDCSTLKVGDDLLAADGGREIIQDIIMHPARPCFRLEFDANGKLTKRLYMGDFTIYQIQLDRSHTFIVGSDGVINGACSTHTIQYAGGGFTDVFSAVQDEVFNLIGGGCASHNFQKA